MHRRQLLLTAALSGSALGAGLLAGKARGAAPGPFKVVKTEAEWRAALTPDQFAILREEATERPFTSQLLENKKHGTYACVGCRTKLYASSTKFESGTGWPSFWDAIPGGIGTTTDYKLVYPRVEAHCATCGGHLGHIFDDGPQPTGKRHCINGLVLNFTEDAAAS